MKKATVCLSLLVTLATSFAHAATTEIMDCEGLKVITIDRQILGVTVPTFYVVDLDGETRIASSEANNTGGDLKVNNFRGNDTLLITVVDHPQVYGAIFNDSKSNLTCTLSK